MDIADTALAVKLGKEPATNELILKFCDAIIDAQFAFEEYASKEFESSEYTDYQLQLPAQMWLDRWNK